MKEEIDALYLAFKTMVEQDEDDSLEEEVDVVCGNIEEQLEDLQRGAFNDYDVSRLEKLQILVRKFKIGRGLYDEQTELDHMFPNRHDDDFDDDSMSYDSVFGDD